MPIGSVDGVKKLEAEGSNSGENIAKKIVNEANKLPDVIPVMCKSMGIESHRGFPHIDFKSWMLLIGKINAILLENFLCKNLGDPKEWELKISVELVSKKNEIIK